jgi:hypothetical protein
MYLVCWSLFCPSLSKFIISIIFFSRAVPQYSGPHGMIDLATCTTVKSADLKSKKRHSLEISTPETQILLYADSESAKDDWIGRVGKAIVRCSRTYYQQPGATTLSNGQPNNQQQGYDDEDDDDIYFNEDPDNPYFND